MLSVTKYPELQRTQVLTVACPRIALGALSSVGITIEAG